MKMLKKLYPALILGIICLICALLLSATYELTKDAVAEQESAAALERKQAIFPEGEQYTPLDIPDNIRSEMDEGGFAPDEIYQAQNESGVLLGYVLVTKSLGYAGDIFVTTGFAPDGDVIHVIATAPDETPELGKEVESSSFLDQFSTVHAGEQAEPDQAGNNCIDTLSGATISSKAVCRAFNSAVDAFRLLSEKGVIGS